MFILGLDFGTKNIGVAIGQKVTKTANALHPIKANQGIPNWNSIKSILVEWQPSLIIIGNPLNINGSKQKITKKVETFANSIFKIFHIPIVLHDERLSTIEAKSFLFNTYGYRSLSKKNIDSFSAVMILESWLDSL
ncbi:Holliday junction resolvase RuvX [Buchnera aphidicola (Hormaphis cornu)]|nr:Holliday junction resolvase RuvX [Buchnera aphidicola (Hormaphis cornu)]